MVHPAGYKLLFILHTGLRLGEALALTWNDYDEDSKTLMIDKNTVYIDGKKITLRGDGNLTGSETCTAQDIIGCVVRIKNKDGKAKPLTPGTVWRHLPTFVKRLYLKIYRIIIKIQSFEHDED